MAGQTIIDGHGRTTLAAETAYAVNSGKLIGVFEVNRYSRMAGMLSVVGSVTFRYRMGINSGTYQVSSSFVANSGPSTFDVLNYGRQVELMFSLANSQSMNAVLVYGEPIR